MVAMDAKTPGLPCPLQPSVAIAYQTSRATAF